MESVSNAYLAKVTVYVRILSVFRKTVLFLENSSCPSGAMKCVSTSD